MSLRKRPETDQVKRWFGNLALKIGLYACVLLLSFTIFYRSAVFRNRVFLEFRILNSEMRTGA